MKTKKLEKKLAFNKVNITNLNEESMKELKAGKLALTIVDCTIPWTYCIPIC
jgi:hypothetical protein